MDPMEIQARKGKVRIFLEVRYDLPFDLDKPLSLKEIANKVITDCGGLGAIPEQCHGEYAEEVHAVLIDFDEGPKTRTEVFEGNAVDGLLFEP